MSQRIRIAEANLASFSDAFNTERPHADRFDMEADILERVLYVTPKALKNVRPWLVPFEAIREMSPMSRDEAKAAAEERLARLTPPPAASSTAPANDAAGADEDPVIDPATSVPAEVRTSSGALTKHKVTAKAKQ